MQHLTHIVAKTVTTAFCALLLVIFAIGQGLAQTTPPANGVALVIGQSTYAAWPALPGAQSDARAIADILTKLGFQTETAIDSKAQDLRKLVDGLIEKAQGADVAFIYYSGHAIESGGINYLLP